MRAFTGAVSIILLLLVGVTQVASGGRPPKPIVGPILAQFVPTIDTTYYAISATEPPGLKAALSITWSLTPRRTDKTCKNFVRSPKSPKVAIWNHAPSDGCDPANFPDEEHPGIVKVVVRDASYVCTATYLGADSGSGDYAVCVLRSGKR
jgi:hypothetical protein